MSDIGEFFNLAENGWQTVGPISEDLAFSDGDALTHLHGGLLFSWKDVLASLKDPNHPPDNQDEHPANLQENQPLQQSWQVVPAPNPQQPPPDAEEQRHLYFKIMLKILEKELLFGDAYFSLKPELRADLLTLLRLTLNDKGIHKVLKIGPGETIKFSADDFVGFMNRGDECAKMVISMALKVIYKQFLKAKELNQDFNPRTYTKRKVVNWMIFKKFFGRNPYALDSNGERLYEIVDPLSSAEAERYDNQEVHLEHMRLFLIKSGVTKDWFEYATGQKGGRSVNWKFFNEINKILDSKLFLENYKKKIASMLKTICGVEGPNAQARSNKRRSHQEESEGMESSLNHHQEDLSDSEDRVKKRKPKHPKAIIQMKEAVSFTQNFLVCFLHKPLN